MKLLKNTVCTIVATSFLCSVSGCASINKLWDDLTQSGQNNGKVVQKKNETPTEENKPIKNTNNNKKKKANQPSKIKEPTENNTYDENSKTTDDASISETSITNAISALSEEAITTFQPRVPNLTMVRYISVASDIKYNGTNLVSIVKNTLNKTNKFELINSSLENRINSQVKQATSSSYIIRLAKAQNIDYLFSGSVKRNGATVVAILKITDIKNGAVVWQRSKVTK